MARPDKLWSTLSRGSCQSGKAGSLWAGRGSEKCSGSGNSFEATQTLQLSTIEGFYDGRYVVGYQPYAGLGSISTDLIFGEQFKVHGLFYQTVPGYDWGVLLIYLEYVGEGENPYPYHIRMRIPETGYERDIHDDPYWGLADDRFHGRTIYWPPSWRLGKDEITIELELVLE